MQMVSACRVMVILGISGMGTALFAAIPQGTGITYQGQLKHNGVSYTGTADIRVKLWDAASGGAMVPGLPVVQKNNVAVVNGLFSTDLDFGAAAFILDARWMEIEVRTPHDPANAAPFTTLAQRQPLSSSPFSLQTRGIVVNAGGDVGIGTSTPGARLDVASATGLSLRVNDDLFVDAATSFVGVGRSARITNFEVFGVRSSAASGFGGMYVDISGATGQPFYGYATGGTARAFSFLEGSDNSWRLAVGSSTRLTINTSGDAGLGTTAPEGRLHVLRGSAGTVTADTNSVLTVENFTNGYLSVLTPDASERGILFGEPSHNAAGGVLYNSGGTPDGLQFRTNGNVARVVIDAQGDFGIGTTNPTAPFEMAMGGRTLQIRNDGGLVPAINLTGTSGNLGILRVRNKIEMFPNDAGTTAASLDVRSATGAVNIFLDGSAGHIDANGAIRVDGANTNTGTTGGGVLRFGGGGSGEVIASKRSAGGNQYGIDFFAGHVARVSITNAGDVGIGTTLPSAKLDVQGRTKTKSLEITGGADVAEPIDISGPVMPGMVVAIDPEIAGRFRIADEPLDRKVAGILSGANGLAAGMVLRAEGQAHADGKALLALSGRVWCWCDAMNGPIVPGDLLTSSATPGHAMRVKDDAAAPRGSIIGKAMTALPEGKGLVLVLVNLQ